MSGGSRHILAAVLAFGLVGATSADDIYLVGTPIPLRGCSIEGFDSGQVVYRDARGRRDSMALDEVRSLAFDDLDALADAEKALAGGDQDEGCRLLMQALLEAPTTVARIWCHQRLARVHDRRGEYLASVRHAAEVWRMDPDPAWRSLRPLRAPAEGADVGSYAVAVEALDALRRARAAVRQRSLRALIDDLLAVVEPIHGTLRAAHAGPEPDPTTTISGVPREAVRNGTATIGPDPNTDPNADPAIDTETAPAAEPAPAPVRRAPRAGGSAPDRPRAAGAGPSSPQIQRLLESGRFDEALAACRIVERDPGDRPLDRLLYQYGAAHLGTGDHRRAAVMFTRVAVHYPGSTLAVAALIETAAIHHRHLRKPETARRLLRTALARAEQLESEALVDRARRELDDLPPVRNGSAP